MSARGRRRLHAAIGANIVLLAALLGYVGSLCYPPSETTRLRNALVFASVERHELEWTPANVPSTFLKAGVEPYPEFKAVAARIARSESAGDYDRAIALASYLVRGARDTGAIGSNLREAHARIVNEGAGYCADFTQVYLGLAHAAGLFAREWAFSLDGFGGHGHAFVEVFDAQLGKWIFIDVYNNIHAADAATGVPLSALEFRDFVLGQRAPALVRRNGPGRLGFAVESKLLDYYRRGAEHYYLWWGNAVSAYETDGLTRLAAGWKPAEQMAAIIDGVMPPIRALRTPANAESIRHMEQLRARLWAVAWAGFILLLLLVAQLAWAMRAKPVRRVESQTRASGIPAR